MKTGELNVPEIGYIINHWVTVAWLSLAGLYVYYVVIADLVKVIRGNKKEQEQGESKT